LLLEKASFSLQNDALIAILIVKGREAVFWKACDELCHVVGSEKTRNRKSTRKKVKKTQRFLDFNLPLCFRPNPETGVAPFHNRSNPCFRVWPEMHWNPLIQILREISAFLPVSLTSVTLVKNGQWVFSGSRHPESFRPNPQTRVAPINAQRNPCLRPISFFEKGVVFPSK